jgi:peptide deformylase
VIRPIVRWGADALHRPAQPVAAVTDVASVTDVTSVTDATSVTDNVQQLVDDMVQTMYAAPGVGLAAPQVGVPLRIFVADVSLGRDPKGLLVFINPTFVAREGMQLEEEGCLSVPGFNATVARPSRVVVRGWDRSGTEHTVEGTGLLARCFQHEMDHLDGRLFVDHLRGLQKDFILRKIKKLARAGQW